MAGDAIDADVGGPRLRYGLNRHHLAYVVWSDGEDFGPDDLTALERVAVAFASGIGVADPLVVPIGRRLVAAWAGAHAPIARNTKRRQFRMCAWELSAGTDSHYQAAFRDAIERGQGVRQRERVAEKRQQDG